jgi:NADH-quinone oxidoreductase subunit G
VKSAWRWLEEIAVGAGRKTSAWTGLDEVIDAMTAELPTLKGAREAAPRADYRLAGRGVPRKSLRESGRTAVTANITLHEPAPARDPDSPLVYTMEGTSLGAPASLNARFWSPGWNSDQSLSKFQAEVSGQLVGGDPGVRLFEPPTGDTGSFFSPAAGPGAGPAAGPSAGPSRDGKLLLVSRHLVFGSEELSSMAPGVAARVGPASLVLSRAECERRGLKEGSRARVSVDGGETVELLVVVKEIAAGVAALAPGAPGTPVVALPAWASVSGGPA